MSRPFTKLGDKIYETDKYDLEKINIRNDVTEYNNSIIRAGSLIMTISFTGMIILSFILQDFDPNRLFYIFETAANALLLFAAKRYFMGRERPTVLGVYIFTALMYYAGIYVDIITRQNNCLVTGCFFLGVLPLLFIDDIMRIMLFSTVAAITNIILIITMKSDAVIATDIVNVTFSWFFGIYLAIRINRIKLKSYINEHIIAIERDTDSMTGLWNKNCLTQKITDHITTKGSKGIFFMMDIDHFKNLNDTFGHSYGDEILIEAAKCTKTVFESSDILRRFGGDEFIFYVPDATEAKAAQLAESLISTLYEKIKLPTEDKGLHVSLGIAVYEYFPDATYDKLMNMADRALYVTKKGGRFGYTVFNEKKMERQTVKL